MKRFHVHVAVEDLAASIRFYSTLFGAEPTVRKDDYAKWQLEDPRVNFAISQRGERAGINHLGIQTDSDEELEALHAQLERASIDSQAEHEVACCYARSNKYWAQDPSGIAWETFHTLASVPTFNERPAESAHEASTATACCAPKVAQVLVKIEVRGRTQAGCCN